MDVLRVIKRNPLIFPMACVAVVAMILISEVSYWRSAGTLDRLGAMAVVATSLHDLQWGILDADAAQKLDVDADADVAGKRQAQLLAYGRAVQSVAGAFKTLDAYYDTQAEPKAMLARLHQLAQVKPASRGPSDPQRMDAIRSMSAELLQFEALNVAGGRASLYNTLMVGRVGVATLSAVGLLTLFVVLRQSSMLESQRREQQEMVQAAHDLLELEVLQRTTELTALTRHLQTAREDERARLARDLHDEMGALMTSAKLDAARIRSRLTALATPAPEALERLTNLIATLNKGIALKRRIVEDLHPSALHVLGLVATLEIMAREFSDSSGLEVVCALAPVKLSASGNLMVYRLMQEALTNISKYAQASHVWLGLGNLNGRVEVSVRDNGVGFDTSAPTRSAHGLVGMRFRVEAEGGTLSIVAAPGLGTLVMAKLPEIATEPHAAAVAAAVVLADSDSTEAGPLELAVKS